MQQPQLVCKKCGQEHTAPYKRSDSALNQTNPQDIDMTKKFIMIMIRKLAGLCTINNWCIDKASMFKREVDLLSSFAHCQGLHELFPAKDDKVGNIKKLIAQLKETCEKLEDDDAKTIQDILRRQICALKVIECKVYSVTDRTVNDTEPEDTIEQDDHEENDNKDILTAKKGELRTRSTPINLTVKTEENIAMKIVYYQSNFHENAICTATVSGHETGTDDAEVRYHYRRANKYSGQKPPPAAVALTPPTTLPTLVTALPTSVLPIPATAFLPSTVPTPVAILSVPPQAIPAAVSVTAPVPSAIIGIGKRKAASERRGSSPVKHRRKHDDAHRPGSVSRGHLVDKGTMLRQVTCLNISFESFTDMSLRQAESDRKHREQEAAFEKDKQAYEESKRVFEERKRAYEESMKVLEEKKQVFKDNERLCEENKSVYVATQECLATRAESAGENIIEEANNFLSSIEQRQPPQDIFPALQRLRSVFGDFIRVQGELAEEHKFRGDRARLLYILMKRIHEAVGIEVLVEGSCPDGSSRCC